MFKKDDEMEAMITYGARIKTRLTSRKLQLRPSFYFMFIIFVCEYVYVMCFSMRTRARVHVCHDAIRIKLNYNKLHLRSYPVQLKDLDNPLRTLI